MRVLVATWAPGGNLPPLLAAGCVLARRGHEVSVLGSGATGAAGMLQSADGWTTDLRSLAATHRALGLAPIRDGLTAWESPELLLVTAPRWLDVDADAPDHVIHAGPLNVAARRGASTRGDGARPRVLLSFSTTVMEGQTALIDRVGQAIAGLDLDAVLTLGPAVDPEAVHVPDGVKTLAFADHDDVMPDCAAVIGHGGLGTVLRALAHGVPQLLLPLGRDQPFNASRVEELDAGIALATDVSPERIRIALQTLLDDVRFRAAAVGVADRIAAADPDRAAAEALERVGEKD